MDHAEPPAHRLVSAQEAWLNACFVGREPELEVFGRIIRGESKARVVYVYGPGGIGKSSLLARVARAAEDAGIGLATLDGRRLDPSPNAFLGALAEARTATTGRRRQMIVVDSYERLTPLDVWVRDVFAPELPADVCLVLAGRNVPAAGWRAAPGWGDILVPMPVASFGTDECQALLARRHVPTERHEEATRLTYGHPLALWLLSEALLRDPGLSLDETPIDVVRTLVATLIDQGVPGPDHRQALEAAVLVRVLDEPLLQAMLGRADVAPLFEWLASLAWIETGPDGLMAHDLFRETLEVELRWRHRDRHAAFVRRAAEYYTGRFATAGVKEQGRLAVDRVYLHRKSPVLAAAYDWQAMARFHLDVVKSQDHGEVVALVALHEGEASAAIAAMWLGSPAASSYVFREDGAVSGVCIWLTLERARPEELRADPGAAATWRYVVQQGGLREGECACQYRVWMSREHYQRPSPFQNAASAFVTRMFAVMPGLRYVFYNNTMPEIWSPICELIGIPRLPEADFVLGPLTNVVYVSDFRRISAADYLNRIALAEDPSAPGPPPSATEPLVQLGRSEFDKAVRQALRVIGRPGDLGKSPLVHARLVWLRVGPSGASVSARAALLEEMLRDAIAKVGQSPSAQREHAVLVATWLEPHEGQKFVADALGLPFGTYRRHVEAGLNLVADALWAWETAD